MVDGHGLGVQHGQHVVEMHPAALDEARHEPAAVAAAHAAAASGD